MVDCLERVQHHFGEIAMRPFLAGQSEECAPLSVATGTQPVIVLL